MLKLIETQIRLVPSLTDIRRVNAWKKLIF